MAVSTPASVRAEPREPEATDGTIVALDAGDFVVDVGATKGAHDGDVVDVWRPVRLRHPVSGLVLLDRFRIGALRLVQVRRTLSLAIVEGKTSRTPVAGDVLVLAEARDPSADGTPGKVDRVHERVAPLAPEPIVAAAKLTPGSGSNAGLADDAEARDLAKLMTSLTGSEPGHRAVAYEMFVRAHASSRFATVLREETAALRAPREVERQYLASAPKLGRVRAGVPQRFAVELDPLFVGAVVHVRRRGAASYRSIPMGSSGPRYWTATLPGDAMTNDGMEYFVEGLPKASPPVAIVGKPETPRRVEVDALPGPLRVTGTKASVSVQSEFASFNVTRANDYVWQTEGSVGWRLRDEGLRAVRSGFGVLRGQGGSLDDLDRLQRDPSPVGLTYGYVEAEIALSPTFSILARPVLGLRERGVTGGAQGFVRIGSDLRTNLSVGGEVLGSVGQRGIVQLDWRTLRRLPIALRTEVTNQPADGSDVGARAIIQVGYEVTPEFALAARVSYQGRTIHHAGPGTGLAVSYQW